MVEKESPFHPIPLQQSLGSMMQTDLFPLPQRAGSQYDGEKTASRSLERASSQKERQCSQELLIWQRKHCMKSNRCIQLQLK